MKNKNKKIFNKSNILKFLLFSSFLLSIPLLHDTKVNAGLEFQWDQDSGHRKLKWFQKVMRRELEIQFFSSSDLLIEKQILLN